MNILKKTASADAALAGRQVIKKIVLVAGAAAAATVIIFDSAAQSGGVDCGKIAAVTGDTRELCFGEEGKIFENGLSLTLAGADAVVYIHY